MPLSHIGWRGWFAAMVATVVAATGAVVAPALALDGRSHTVEPGDTLTAIAARYGVTVDELVLLNELENPDHIISGQTLIIDPPNPERAPEGVEMRYVVEPGDTLGSIAAEFGGAIAEIAEANELIDPDHIVSGQVLVIPGTELAPPVVSHEEAEAAIRAAADEFDVDPALLLALAWQESGWQQHVVSSAGAVGVMQVLPSTAAWAQEFLVWDAAHWQTDVHANARVGASILSHYLYLEGGDARLALAAYYQGWRSVHEFGLFDETEAYVANVLALTDSFR